MAVIKPKLTLTGNSASATTDPGPASIGVNLTAAPANGKVTVTALETFIYQTTTSTVKIWDHANAEVYLYIKNQATTASNNDAYIGIASTDLSANQDARVMTLSAGDFAFLPWAGEHDLWVEGGSATPKLEVWIFKTT